MLFAALLMTVAARPVFAQEGKEKARDLLTKVQQAYRAAGFLGFRVKYVYANAGQPGHRLDSLEGEVQMEKDRCRFVIDGTETVVTNKYTIQVMKEDKAIYLSGSKPLSMVSPAGLADSLFAHMAGVTATVVQESASQELVLTFPPGAAYSRVRMLIDPLTGFFQQVSYELHTESLVGQDMIGRPGHPGPYEQEGQIDIIFSNYIRGGFGEGLFNEKNFFDKVAGAYQPAARYKDYHIFLASSNL